MQLCSGYQGLFIPFFKALFVLDSFNKGNRKGFMVVSAGISSLVIPVKSGSYLYIGGTYFRVMVVPSEISLPAPMLTIPYLTGQPS